jgi:hypothetical protein
LPRTFNDGAEVPAELFLETVEELLRQFGAYSLMPGSVEGAWMHEGKRHEDLTRRVVVDVEDTAENRQFFVEWKPVLRERFKQIEIDITSTVIDVI